RLSGRVEPTVDIRRDLATRVAIDTTRIDEIVSGRVLVQAIGEAGHEVIMRQSARFSTRRALTTRDALACPLRIFASARAPGADAAIPGGAGARRIQGGGPDSSRAAFAARRAHSSVCRLLVPQICKR